MKLPILDENPKIAAGLIKKEDLKQQTIDLTKLISSYLIRYFGLEDEKLYKYNDKYEDYYMWIDYHTAWVFEYINALLVENKISFGKEVDTKQYIKKAKEIAKLFFDTAHRTKDKGLVYVLFERINYQPIQGIILYRESYKKEISNINLKRP